MDDHTYKLINMLERAPREMATFEGIQTPDGFPGGGKKEIVKPAYLLASDVERIIRLLEADVVKPA